MLTLENLSYDVVGNVLCLPVRFLLQLIVAINVLVLLGIHTGRSEPTRNPSGSIASSQSYVRDCHPRHPWRSLPQGRCLRTS